MQAAPPSLGPAPCSRSALCAAAKLAAAAAAQVALSASMLGLLARLDSLDFSDWPLRRRTPVACMFVICNNAPACSAAELGPGGVELEEAPEIPVVVRRATAKQNK